MFYLTLKLLFEARGKSKRNTGNIRGWRLKEEKSMNKTLLSLHLKDYTRRFACFSTSTTIFFLLYISTSHFASHVAKCEPSKNPLVSMNFWRPILAFSCMLLKLVWVAELCVVITLNMNSALIFTLLLWGKAVHI